MFLLEKWDAVKCFQIAVSSKISSEAKVDARELQG